MQEAQMPGCSACARGNRIVAVCNADREICRARNTPLFDNLFRILRRNACNQPACAGYGALQIRYSPQLPALPAIGLPLLAFLVDSGIAHKEFRLNVVAGP